MDDARKTICFDLDGVLCSLTEGHYENALPDCRGHWISQQTPRSRMPDYHLYGERFMGRNDQNVLAAYKEGYDSLAASFSSGA